MLRVSIMLLAMFACGNPALAGPSQSSAQGQAKPYVPRPPYASQGASSDSSEGQAERQLFELVNQARAQAGAPRLEMDAGLARAARAHTLEMVARQQLSHQFPEEPPLLGRLMKNTKLPIDGAAENVASAATIEQVHDVLMHSPSHRENLMDPAYNVAGFSVVRSGSMFYATEDFGHRTGQ